MAITRILLGNISQEWKRKVLDLANSDPQLKIVAELADPFEVLVQAQEWDADVVLLSQVPGRVEPGICSHLLLEHPNLVLVLLPALSGPDVLYRMVLVKEERRWTTNEDLHAMLRPARQAG